MEGLIIKDLEWLQRILANTGLSTNRHKQEEDSRVVKERLLIIELWMVFDKIIEIELIRK